MMLPVAQRLEAYLARHSNTPFKYGEFDCVMFAAGWVDEYTGSDYCARGFGYQGAREGVRALRCLGGMIAGVSQHLGLPTFPAALQVGDLALLKQLGVPNERLLLGIVLPQQVAAPRPDRGWIAVGHDHLKGGWHLCPRSS